MLVTLKCKECNTTFNVEIDAFYDDSVKCPHCYASLDKHFKQRLFDINDNLQGLNKIMNKFSVIGINDAQPESYMFNDLTHLESLYLNADKNSKALIENIIDNIYILSRSPLERGDLKELADIYKRIHSLFLEKCNFENKSTLSKILNPNNEESLG